MLLCLSHLRWDSVYQRPQHLMSRATRSYRVVFVEEPVHVPPDPGLPRMVSRVSPEGVLVATPPHVVHGQPEIAVEAQQAHLLNDLVAGLAAPVEVVWFYTPMALAYASSVQAMVTVFDSMDELSAFRGASPRLLLERHLLRQADLVFAGGRSLREAKSRLHPRVHLFPSSVDVPHFQQARETIAEPADQAGLPHPRLGFHGVVDERMDLDLVTAIADLRAAQQLVMVGPVAKLDPASLPQRGNLYWLGQRPCSALLNYLAGWDIGLMPFAMNDATRYISPTKTPEFLAAGVPTVSTPVPDVVKDWAGEGLVEIASGAEQMVTAIERLLAMPKPEWRARVDQRLRSMSWDPTWARMLGLIQEAAQPTHKAAPKQGVLPG